MDQGYDQLKDDYLAVELLPEEQVNAVAKILDTQIHGAMEGHGAGVIAGGVTTDGGGLTVSVAALKAILDTTKLLTYIQTEAPTVVSGLPADSTVYIHATAVFLVSPGDPDSREDATVDIDYSLLDSEADSLLLAEVVTGAATITSVTDRRAYTVGQTALDAATSGGTDITAIETYIGADYFDGTPPTDIDTRLDAVEAAAGGPNYWENQEKNAGDTTTPGAEMDSKDAAVVSDHISEYHAAGADEDVALPEVWAIDAVNQAKMLLRMTRTLDPDMPVNQVDALNVVWGIFGDGSGTPATPDFIDRVNSTWLPT